MFLTQEYATLAALNHPQVPSALDLFRESGEPVLVLACVDGEDLERKLASTDGTGQPERDVLGWASQVLGVLEYLEQQEPQVVHRDLQPSNILVDRLGRVTVLDFSVATHGARSARSVSMGAPGYAPREQFMGEETTRSGLYALGVTMHHLLTGRNPYGEEPLFVYPPIATLNCRVSRATARLVARALENDPERRWQRAAELRAAVERAHRWNGLFGGRVRLWR